MDDVDAVNKLERGAQLDHQVTYVTLRIGILVLHHVTKQVRTTLTVADKPTDKFTCVLRVPT